MMQNGLGESFWDAHGVEIGAGAIFGHFAPSDKIDGTGKKMTESILWAQGVEIEACAVFKKIENLPDS